MNNENINYLSFLLGVLSTVIIPVTVFIINKLRLHYQFKRISDLIKDRYSFDDEHLEKYNSRIKLERELDHQSGENIKRLTYLKQNEVIYMNSDNKEKVIRLIEYTKIYNLQVGKELKNKKFVQPTEKVNDDPAEAIQKIKELTRHYKSTVSEYVKYKREDLVSNRSDSKLNE